MYEAYIYSPALKGSGAGVPLHEVYAAEPLWVLDLHQVYGVDVDVKLLRSRPARWLTLRLVDLLHREGTRLRSYFYPPEDKS